MRKPAVVADADAGDEPTPAKRLGDRVDELCGLIPCSGANRFGLPGCPS